MGILSALQSYFKKIFGTPNPKPEGYRKLKKAELAKLGLSEKSERYVRADLKKPNKKSKTFSKRAVQQARAGKTLEQRAEANRPKKRVLKTGAVRTDIPMPLDPRKFQAKMVRIIREYGEDEIAYVLIVYASGRGVPTMVTTLGELDYDTVISESDVDHKRYKTESLGKIASLYLRIDE